MAVDLPSLDATDADDCDEHAMLLEFLRDRDVLCPRCGYNLRNLTRATCPECKEPLQLQVGLMDLPIIGLLVTLVPSYFAAVCALLITIAVMSNGFPGVPTGPFCGMWGGAAVSGIAACILSIHHRPFIRLSDHAQAMIAIGNWLIHIAAILFLLTIP